MMEYKRLTKYNEYSQNAEVYAYTVDKDVYFDGIDIVDNENSSLAQETIDRLAELEDKIEKGTLLELACKKGDKVYQPDCVRIYELTVFGIRFFNNKFYYETQGFWFDNTAIGKSIFLTREEAEKRLEELKK